MGNLFAELKRRHIYRVAAGYTVVAWLIIQFVNNIAPMLKLPDWIAAAILVVLMAGLPVALVFAWVVDLKAPNASSATRTGAVDWVFAAVATAIVALLTYQQFATLGAGTVQKEAGLEAARIAAAKPAGISVAVLPFENLSGDASQEFFSDGMTQEIVAALAKIPDLRVVARGSASQFKGEKKDLRAVGQALGATHLIEGSVRKAGTRVRITAQLVKADDDVNIWVNSYDRELTDIFAVQEDIATSIAGALRMPLGLKPGEQLVTNRAIDPKSYEQFLRGKAALLQGRAHFSEQIGILEPITVRNPRYAPGWAALAGAYRFAVNSYDIAARQAPERAQALRSRDTFVPKLDAAARRAIELDPDSVDALLVQALIQAGRKKVAVAEDFVSKALALDQDNPDALNLSTNSLLVLGRVKDAVATGQRLSALEPIVPIYAGNLAEALWLDGQTDAAIAILKDNLGRVGAGATQDLARVYASLGRYGEAADILTQFSNPAGATALAPVAVPLLRSAPAKVAAPETLPALGRLGFVYLYVGAPGRMLDFYEQSDDTTDFAFLWHPSYSILRKTDRFKKIVSARGLIEYWRERGWPEFCHPTTGDDFECS